MSESGIGAELARAEALVAAGDLDGARAIADRVLAGAPGHSPAHNLRGFIAHREGRLHDAEREFALAGDDEDAHANLAAVRAELASGGAGDEADFAGTLEDLAGGLFGDLSPRLLGALLAYPLEPALHQRLDELPTATSIHERCFLFRFAARFWDGRGDVFENGPLLGGTTRALALGMLANARRQPGTALHTYDWFSSRVPLDLPAGAFERLVAEGFVTPAQQAAMEGSGSFQGVYDALHAGEDYGALITSHEAYLPGARDDVPAHGEAVYAGPERGPLGLVFVDGCKSWYGTKHWFARTCESIRAGGHLVFQDYGWYTCFWLPVLVGLLPEHFVLIAHVDDTYAFELIEPVDPAAVDARFPDHPAELGRKELDRVFSAALTDAGNRGDTHGIVAHTIQHAAALAYLGRRDEARERIAAMRSRPEFASLRERFIERAIVSPTYTPEGPITL